MAAKWLYSASDRYWDIAGMAFGALGCLALLGQLVSELQRQGASSLSLGFVLGFVAVYGFWLAYGLRFARPAIIFTNAVALCLQLALFGIVLWR
ncbi:hypothetical protein [Gilvimarinus algae]|uniref:Uncharacterized protein n=1 Tax=Gilvimarinus algae TaxID=3058037 RepID=A0ABT8TBR1_9GAMM|nr:hypothetical protein [Gilvimarinus sp. SDUM040014]MDO3381539.1 hypothetical protein [Gilvimarinus sp. SDUM040014]